MQKSKLGNTQLTPTRIGVGGFHLIETPQQHVDDILNTYLDRGGNYLETAADYGDGLSEKKIAHAVSHRRNDYILASKCGRRTKNEAEASIHRSLRNLNTDRLDILFMHAVQSREDVDQILAPGGAMEAVRAAQQAGKVRYVAISGHGQPDALIYAIDQFEFDILMAGFNYFDRCNFPDTEDVLLKKCLEKQIGVIGMKALADGYLYRSTDQAIRYALSLPITTLVLGINTREYLLHDLELLEQFQPMTAAEKDALLMNAIELGQYVCRQCKQCDVAGNFKPTDVFLLEGEFDRQMDSGSIADPAHWALAERLKHWFAQREQAITKYAAIKHPVDVNADYKRLNPLCPYGIDVDRKLKLAHAKLGKDGYVF
ncbi:aldo/keto reductase [candidate division KSB1 bacterium]|nr:aldo/keto reductase [candidate division KSB1 bacterium]